MRKTCALLAVIGAVVAAGCAETDRPVRVAAASGETRECWETLTRSQPAPWTYTLRQSDTVVCATRGAIAEYEAKSDIIREFCSEAACYRDESHRDFSPSLCTLYDRFMTHQARPVSIESRAIRHSAEHGAWVRRADGSGYPLAMSHGFDLLALEEAEHCAWWHEERAARREPTGPMPEYAEHRTTGR
ncbi:MAG: hypothetical protein JRG76_10335 [Deltaproteobacteria bacterium]|nr:hypothetical protein [Deltaproteobacteria bacterium]MBW2414894.1 hypothetical protein [Deltaproteobacteria bacterium]